MRAYIPNKRNSKETDESSDTYDTIDWLVKNIKHNNGNVGIWGISYPGFYAAMSLIDSHPALKAVSPQAPISDWFIGDDTRFCCNTVALDTILLLVTPGTLWRCCASRE